MKKKLLIIFGSIVAVTLVAFGTSYLLSLHKVSFSLQGEATGATIYQSDKQKVKHIDSDSSALLKKGDYYAVPEGNNVAATPIRFIVDKSDIAVMIDPAYSDDYLKKQFTKEGPAISAAITAKYPSVFTNYTLVHGTLYKKGDWFGGLLKPKVSDPREQKDPYRIVLHKQNGTWEVIRRPEYILTSSKYENVPIDVLRMVNLIAE